MIHKIITPLSKLDLAKKTRHILKWHTIVFLVSLVVLPLLSYSLFQFKWVTSKAEFSNEIEAPVAQVLINGNCIGTAFLISPTTMLTARHVVEGKKIGEEIDVYFDKANNQNRIKASIQYIAETSVSTDKSEVPLDYFTTDFAILKVTEISDITPLNIGSSADAKNLDEVVLIGYPIGDFSITKGNINSDKYQGVDLFKLDATANPGNSGGPCISKADNSVIGILVGGPGTKLQGENVALKIDNVVSIAKQAGIKL